MDLTAANLANLCRALLSAHGEVEEWLDEFPLQALAGDPLDLLIGTILSQATNDRNSARAYADLRRIFPDWEAVLAAPVEEVAAAIAAGGLNRQKARSIKAILRRIAEDRGALSLDFLRGLPAIETRRYLTSLPGVGPKTAACVQLFALGQAAFPVDTHIFRVAGRLGLLPPETDRVKAQAALEAIVRPADCLPLHLALIQQGRKVCRPARPRCGECPLEQECALGKRARADSPEK